MIFVDVVGGIIEGVVADGVDVILLLLRCREESPEGITTESPLDFEDRCRDVALFEAEVEVEDTALGVS